MSRQAAWHGVDRGSRQAAGGARRGRRLRRSALRADSAAMLGLRSRRETRCVRVAHCAQTVATSQLWMRAARADRSPALLAATDSAPDGHRLPRNTAFRSEHTNWWCKGASGQVAERLWSAEKRKARGRARSALPPLTCRICLSAVSEANVASYAAGRETEHRRAVGAQRRPLQRSAAACPDVPLPHGRWPFAALMVMLD